MATKDVTKTRLDLNEVKEVTFTSATSSDDIYFDYNGAGDNKLLILANGAVKLTFKKGDAIQGVVNVEGTITTSGAVVIDSGMFKATKTNATTKAVKGKVYVTANSAVSVALIQLP